MKINFLSKIMVSGLALLTTSATLRAAIPPMVTVQGELGQITAGEATNVIGNSQEMALNIRSATNATTVLFGRTKIPVLLEQGRFVAEIGNGAGLTNAPSGAIYSSFADMLADEVGNQFFLGFQLTGFSTDLFPMMRIQSVPFALVAGDAKQATRTFDVLNGTATLSKMIVQGETRLRGSVTYEAASSPVFNEPVSISGNVNVTDGATTLSALTVDGASMVLRATLNSVNVSGGATTINGNLTASSGMTTVNGATSIASGKKLSVANNLTFSGDLNASSFQAPALKVTSAFQVPATAKIKQVFGERKCISDVTTTPPPTDSGWSNAFYQVTSTSTSSAGSSYGYWKAPQDCFVTANYVVGRYNVGEQYPRPIALMDNPSTDYHVLTDTANCIAKPYIRHDLGYSMAAQKNAVCIFMKKGQYLCWFSGFNNSGTVFGAGFMREISVLYFAD